MAPKKERNFPDGYDIMKIEEEIAMVGVITGLVTKDKSPKKKRALEAGDKSSQKHELSSVVAPKDMKGSKPTVSVGEAAFASAFASGAIFSPTFRTAKGQAVVFNDSTTNESPPCQLL